MSLENEYFHLKEGLKAEKEKLAKAEAIEIVEDNSNPFTVEERLEAKNKSIKMSNEIIKELEEMFEEVKNELKEFINNGGEVSEITRNEFKETINFKIISNKNENIYCEGYVTINDEEAEDVDWYYWTGKGYQSRPFYHHNEEEITGLTDIQNNEIDTFIADYSNDALWIDTCILQSNKDENRSYVRENCTLVINEGAKMECEIKEIDPVFNKGDYVVELIPQFNGKRIDIASYMAETFEEFDPWNVGDDSSYIEDGHIFFEMSKDYWDDDCKEERLAEVNEECRRIYARSLTRELGIYARYGEITEQLMDGDYDEDWLFQMTQLLKKSDEELDAFLREEGYIDDELDY